MKAPSPVVDWGCSLKLGCGRFEQPIILALHGLRLLMNGCLDGIQALGEFEGSGFLPRAGEALLNGDGY
jgi:hypothetical protein